MSAIGRFLVRCWAAIAWVWNHSIGWVLTSILVVLIRGYQLLVSPLLPPTCRFHPSCSAYGLESMRTHGALKGTALTAWRLMRCNPWNDGGVDPVPAHRHWLPDVHPNGEPRSGTMKARSAADTNV
jgi:putative membrane protein insertion efficiency factor